MRKERGDATIVVIKRDGREVPFHKSNIRNAICKSFEDIAQTEPVKNADTYADTITNRLHSRYRKRNRAISVEEIQDDVENELMKEGLYAAAKAYIKYRYEHEEMCIRDSHLYYGYIAASFDEYYDAHEYITAFDTPGTFKDMVDKEAKELPAAWQKAMEDAEFSIIAFVEYT